MRLERVDTHFGGILREHRVRRADIGAVAPHIVEIERIPAAPCVAGIILIPQASLDLMRAQISLERGDQALALDAVFGGAHDIARGIDRGGELRLRQRGIVILDRAVPHELQRAGHHAHAIVVVHIDLVRPGDVAGQTQVILQIAQIIGALRIGIVIAIVHRLGLVEQVAAGIDIGARRIPVRVEERAGVGLIGLRRRGRVDVAGGGVLVRLDLVRKSEIAGQLADAVFMRELGIGLPATLHAAEIPRAGALAQAGEIQLVAAAKLAAFKAGIGARRAIGTNRLVQIQPAFGRRVAAEHFHRAAKVAG